jgi:broad specificity phosphatase PhoE
MKTVLLLRHADINPPNGPAPDDWPLNAEGQARAEARAHVDGAAGVTALFVSAALRTQQTAAPLASELGLQSEQVPPSFPQLVQQVLSDESGNVVLIVGHSNTVPQMINALGAPFVGPPVHGHDDLFVVTVVELNTASVVRLKYGNRSA